VRPGIIAASLAALPQLFVFAGHVRSGDYPGSAYAPRVTTILNMSASAAEGGPFAAMRRGEGWVLAAGIVPDIGVPALVDVYARLHGRPATEHTLGAINLVVLAAALFGLVAAFPEPARWALVPVFLLAPLSVVAYRSPDTVAIHGALAALAIAAAASVARAGPLWTAALVGGVLFALGKVRSVYGAYGLLALVLVTVAVSLLTRTRRTALRAGVALATLALLELLWAPLMHARATDRRVVDRDVITSHDVFATVISGVGWSPNRWGIEPPDPRVATFIGRRLGLPLGTRLDTRESERYARTAYLSLWREDPLHLVGLYAVRVEAGVADHVVLGAWGAPAWLAAVAGAAAVAWRRREPETLAAVVGGAAVTGCLLAQVAVIDPRYIYAYPLRMVSALTLAVAGAVLGRELLAWRARVRALQGAANSSRG
jgi:hypothetical protein